MYFDAERKFSSVLWCCPRMLNGSQENANARHGPQQTQNVIVWRSWIDSLLQAKGIYRAQLLRSRSGLGVMASLRIESIVVGVGTGRALMRLFICKQKAEMAGV